MTLDRRHFLAVCSRAGVASTLLPGVLYTLAAQAQDTSSAAGPEGAALPKITPEMISAAAALAGVTVSPEQEQVMLEGLQQQREGYASIRALHLANGVAPVYIFDPLPPGAAIETGAQAYGDERSAGGHFDARECGGAGLCDGP